MTSHTAGALSRDKSLLDLHTGSPWVVRLTLEYYKGSKQCSVCLQYRTQPVYGNDINLQSIPSTSARF